MKKGINERRKEGMKEKRKKVFGNYSHYRKKKKKHGGLKAM